MSDVKKKNNNKKNHKKTQNNSTKSKQNKKDLLIKKLKSDLKLSQEKALNLEKKVFDLETQNQKNIHDFQEKAKGFAKKAQKEVSRLEQEIKAKQIADLAHHKKYGLQKMLEAILEPLINIELAIKVGKQNEAVKAYVIGFEMLLTQLENELASFGVFKILPKVNDTFDPQDMHAVAKKENGLLVTVVKKPGFKLHDRIIKPAIVEID